MNQAAQCKFCGQPMVLVVDDEYAKLGDGFNLLKMATCDRCADLLERKRETTKAIKRAAASYMWMRKSTMSQQEKGKMEGILSALLRRFTGIAGEWRRLDLQFEEAMTEQVMRHPENVMDVLSSIWRM